MKAVLLLSIVLLIFLTGCSKGSQSVPTPTPAPTPTLTPIATPSPTITSTTQSIPSPTPETGIAVGKLAPDFSLQNLQGKEVRLSDFRGKVILLYFWAAWCPNCYKESLALRKLYQNYEDKDFVILAPDVGGRGESIEKIEKYIEELALPFIPLIDFDGEASKEYKVSFIPTTFIIDREGVIRRINIGRANWEWDKDILFLLFRLLGPGKSQ